MDSASLSETKMKPVEGVCPCCGRKITVYKHVLNQRLIAGLRALYSVGGSATLRDVSEWRGLTYSESANFQKLRYFGLVEKEKRTYRITQRGKDFLFGLGASPAYVKTSLATVIEEGPGIFINEVSLPVQEREDFEAQV